MMKSCVILVLTGILTGPGWAAAPSGGEGYPGDLLRPEGKSRWDLAEAPSRFGASSGLETALDPAAGEDVRYWLHPERFREKLTPGRRDSLVLRYKDRSRPPLFVDLEVVGIGWADLPRGPRETVLQRAVLHEEEGPVLAYRWVDPDVGVVAEARGTGEPGLAGLSTVSSGFVSESVIAAAADLKIYSDELIKPVETTLIYGWDKGENTPVSSLTPEAYPTIGDLIAASTWDFSQNTSGTIVAQVQRDVTSGETCNYNQCGYNLPGAKLDREDHDFSGPNRVTNNQATEVTQDASGVTVWLRAGRQKEGVTGGFGTGETGFCFTTDGGVTRTPVALWRFGHQDPNGWYMQAGDTWTDGPFQCEQNLYNYSNGCGSGTFPTNLYTKACSGFSGTQSVEVIKGGVVTLPSGHTLNALLARTMAEYCVYTGSSCFLPTDDVRTVVYLWQVPELGTVVNLQSFQTVPDAASFTELQNTNIAFRLFPPLSITATGSDTVSVDLSWNPGNNTTYIDGYKVYWDTDSGAATPYAFNSVDNPGQAAITGTQATISGLDPDTLYYFTVTSLSDYTSPDSGLTVRHESIVYPTQVSGDPDHVYPVEVTARTAASGCVPTEEVQNLVFSKVGADQEICWDASMDPCLQGYDVLGSDTADSAAGFSTVGSTDAATTCWTGNPAGKYFLVTVRGSGGNGPWGHYGQ